MAAMPPDGPRPARAVRYLGQALFFGALGILGSFETYWGGWSWGTLLGDAGFLGVAAIVTVVSWPRPELRPDAPTDRAIRPSSVPSVPAPSPRPAPPPQIPKWADPMVERRPVTATLSLPAEAPVDHLARVASRADPDPFQGRSPAPVWASSTPWEADEGFAGDDDRRPRVRKRAIDGREILTELDRIEAELRGFVPLEPSEAEAPLTPAPL